MSSSVSASSTMYSMEIEPVTVNKVRTQPWVRSKDYVRCFCNLPQCIRTGYMCKSSQGGCFSNFLENFAAEQHHSSQSSSSSRDYRARHGCLELINKEHKCEISTDRDGNVTTKKQTDPKSLVFCCYHDMCNHVDSPQTKTIINNTLLSEEPIENPIQHQHHDSIGDLPQPIDYSNSQVWFRAATIAVPVCGAVILFVLIALAVKILRNENQNGNANRKLGSEDENETKQNRTYENLLRRNQEKSGFYYNHSEDLQRIQMPLLIQNEIVSHLSNKNETNAKYNLINGESIDAKQVNNSKAIILDIEKECTSSKCDNINLARTNDDYCVKDEKIFKQQLHQQHH